jgi:sugar phosphate isomerase/epimerase
MKLPTEVIRMSDSLSRRKFLQLSSAAALASATPASALSAGMVPAGSAYKGTICLFSKCVPQMTWTELAQNAKRAGFAGIDLTTRDDGHVKPTRVVEDLPKAVAAIRAEGLEVPMLTTELLRADDPTAEQVLSTAGKLKIPYIKPGYYKYKFVDVRKELAEAGEQFRGLVALAQKHGVQVGYHNHWGYIGAPVWDMARIIDTIDPKAAGFYFDILHATVEGGEAGWKIATNLVLPRLKMIAIKDFYWEKPAGKEWRERSCPVGEGMCHLKEYLTTVAKSGFHGPISIHLEYEIPGVSDNQGRALSRDKCETVMAAAKKDYGTLQSLLRQAYGAA